MATEAEHTVGVELEDADGNPVEIQRGPGKVEPFRAQFQFNVGRPGRLDVAESQSVAFALNIPVLPLKQLGSYAFAIGVDGTVLRRLPYRLMEQTRVATTGNWPTGFSS